jgi:hypothetical protein
MAKILEIIKDFNVKIALKNIFTKIDEIIRNLSDKEDYITPGTTSQYWRGDKTWQTFPVSELTGSLNASQINSLDTTPITLLAAAGSNKYYIIENVSIFYNGGTTAFTTSAGLSLYYKEYGNDFVEVLPSSVLTSTADAIRNTYLTTMTLSPNIGSNIIINDAIEILADSAISGGNGTINYSIKYRIVTTS